MGKGYDFVYRMVAADGRTVWLHDVVNVDRKQGRPKLLRGFMFDVTERKLEEQSIQQSDRLASLGTFAAGIAHEINNPLGAILSAAEHSVAILDKQSATENVRDMLQTIIESTERCGRIVSGVLEFSRSGTNTRLNTDINEIIQRAANITRPYAEQRGVSVKLSLAKNPCCLSLSQIAMEQVFVNLFRNSIESGAREICVRERTKRDPKGISIAVQDDGRGLTKEQKRRMFDPFYTTRQGEGGSGLGLSIVHGIVTSHGGSIKVSSEPNKGTTITIQLIAGAPE